VKDTMLQLSKIWSLQEPLSQVKERKEIDEATVAEEREPSKKVKQDKTYFFF
jgi:hypothetical protein